MRKIEYIIVVAVIIFFAVVTYNSYADSQVRRNNFIEEKYAAEIVEVKFENHLNVIELSDGKTIALSTLNWSNRQMDRFYGKCFSEFLFSGDSLTKNSGDLILKIKPKNGKIFILDCR